MRIMTSNIWGNFFNNPPELRKDDIYSVYKKYAPDVLGFQEAAAGWYETDLFYKLSENYYFIGTACYDNRNSTLMAVKKEYTVIADGHEQLEHTPDWSKSITWAVLEKDGKRIAVCNTHFWWMRGERSIYIKEVLGVAEYSMKEHCMLRNINAKQLSELMHFLHKKYSCPVFAFGDMNATVTEEIFRIFEQNGIKNLYDMTEQKDTVCTVHGDPVLGEDGAFHGTRATAEYISEFRKELCIPEPESKDGHFISIDHIIALGEDFEVTQYRVVEDTNALDASDHSPVYADVTLF